MISGKRSEKHYNYNYLCDLHRQDYMFWSDFSRRVIVRGSGIEMASSYADLVTSGIGCAGK